MADLSCSRTNRKRSSFATKHFQRKSLKIFDLHPPLRRLVLFVVGIIAWKVRCWVTDTHTDTQTKYCNPRCKCTTRVKNQKGNANDWKQRKKWLKVDRMLYHWNVGSTLRGWKVMYTLGQAFKPLSGYDSKILILKDLFRWLFWTTNSKACNLGKGDQLLIVTHM